MPDSREFTGIPGGLDGHPSSWTATYSARLKKILASTEA